jgi:hypothetical protein
MPGAVRVVWLSRACVVVAIALASGGCGGAETAGAESDASFDVAPQDGALDASFDVADVRDDAGDSSPDASNADVEPIDAPTCTGDLSNIGAADFHISFTLSTNQAGNVVLAEQRATCGHGVFWDIHMISGAIAVETDDRIRYTVLNATGTVNDGLPHAIVVARVSGTLSVTIDNAASGDAACTSVFGSLAGLEVGTSPCVGIGGFAPLIGLITDMCVTSP